MPAGGKLSGQTQDLGFASSKLKLGIDTKDPQRRLRTSADRDASGRKAGRR